MSVAQSFSKIAVIGAGTMGSGIAARLPMPACRYCSWICRPELAERPAEQAIQIAEIEPPQFMRPLLLTKLHRRYGRRF